jgi:hypothetical protein
MAADLRNRGRSRRIPTRWMTTSDAYRVQLRMDCIGSSSMGRGPEYSGGAQEAFDALEAHAMGSGEGGGGGAFAVGGNQFGDVAFIEVVAQAPRALRARSGPTYRARERHAVATPQVSGLCRVRVSGEYLHRRMPRSLTWAFIFIRCASPFSRRCGRVAISIPLAPHERRCPLVTH